MVKIAVHGNMNVSTVIQRSPRSLDHQSTQDIIVLKLVHRNLGKDVGCAWSVKVKTIAEIRGLDVP